MKKIIFLNISWMKEYNGNKPGYDIPINGGEFPRRNKEAGEEHNYTDVDGYCYGHVETIRGEVDTSIDLENLGGSANDDNVKNVLIIWIATPTGGGRQVIGWWKDAVVYRKRINAKKGQKEFSLRSDHSYITKAKTKNCILLSPIEREIYPFNFPIHPKKNWPGQSSRFYPLLKIDKADSFKNYFNDLLKHIKSYKPKLAKKTNIKTSKNNHGYKNKKGTSFLHRSKIENEAVSFIMKYYDMKLLPVEIRDVSSENKGWDLEIVLDNVGNQLNVECKGLSGQKPFVGLTPNEYLHFKSKYSHYRLFVVTGCLSKKQGYEIFWDGRSWKMNKISSSHKTKASKAILNVKEMMSAHVLIS